MLGGDRLQALEGQIAALQGTIRELQRAVGEKAAPGEPAAAPPGDH